MEAIFSFISSHYPTIGIVIIACLIVYWATMYHASIQNIRKKVEVLPCDANGKKLDMIELKLDRLTCDYNNHTQKFEVLSQEIHEQSKKSDVHFQMLLEQTKKSEIQSQALLEQTKKLNGQDKTLEKHSQKFEVLSQDFLEQTKKLNGQDRTLVNHTQKIADISVWIMKNDKLMIPVFMGAQSPLYLKPTGIALLEVSGGKKCIDENIDFFMSKLEDIAPMTPYDVEESSLSVIVSNTGLPMFNPVKNYIYFQPETIELEGEKVEISFFAVAYLMGIYLRDIYFEKHPEILEENRIQV